jgi:hypothetical protein
MAAPSPCTALAAIRSTAVGVSAQPTDAAIKIAKPAMKTRFAPIRSPSAPAVRMKPANAIV